MNVPKSTIIYYTASREDPKFEAKIQANIVNQKGDLPIISVSQKPLDFGQNICIGNVGLSYLNQFRQMYIGARQVKTPYIIYAESDALYPPEYFSFTPTEKDVSYRYNNNYLVYNHPKMNYFYKKKEYEGAQIVGTEFFLKKFEEFFIGMPMWFPEGKGGAMPIRRREPLHKARKVFFGGENPVLTFKTGKGVSWVARIEKGREKTDVPYWGHICNLRKEYLQQ